MKFIKKILIVALSCIPLLLTAQSKAVRMLDNDRYWDIAGYIVSTDYRPTKHPRSNPDRGMQMVMRELEKTISPYIEQHKLLYYSTDPNGDSILLSGCLYLPKQGDIRRLIVANHYTVCSNAEVPSQSLSFESVFCLKGYAVLMADYLGYGVTSQQVHPYLHRQTEAQNVIDLVLQTIGGKQNRNTGLFGHRLLNDSIIIVGYSQGAAVSIAVMDMLQTCYADDIHISKTYVGGGPYDPASMYDEWVENDYTSIPCAIPLTILGMDYGENLNLDLTHLFKDSLLMHYDEWVLSKKYSVNRIAQIMGSNKLTDCMPPTGLDKNDSQTRLFYQAMQRQSLLDFIPHSPLLIFHSYDDKWVPFHCSKRLADNIGNNPLTTTDFGNYGNHMNAGIRFYKNIYRQL